MFPTLFLILPLVSSSHLFQLELATFKELHSSFALTDSDFFPVWRSYSGWGNNLDPTNLKKGSHNQGFFDTVPREYHDGANGMNGGHRRSCREISNFCASDKRLANTENFYGLSNLLWQWGQFIDHDTSETKMNMSDQVHIPIPPNDPFFDSRKHKSIRHARSAKLPGSGTSHSNPRNQINTITSFIDGSMIYGSDQERAQKLRSHKHGKLLTTPCRNLTGRGCFFDFLPKNKFDLENAGPRNQKENLFVAGDVRVNEQAGLTAMHTLFVREHNRLCDAISKALGLDDDELLYQYARAIVIAMVQHITYNEFLGAVFGMRLDEYVPPYQGYRPHGDASVSSLFSTSAFRVGHTMVSAEIPRLDSYCQKTPFKPIRLENAFFKPSLMSEAKTDQVGLILNGLACTPAMEIDGHLVGGLRNLLFKNVPDLGGVPLDLFALNCNRQRDHGIPDYETVRTLLGLKRKRTWDAFIAGSGHCLRHSYNHNMFDMDFFVAGICEKHLPGCNLGESFATVWGDQFRRSRDHDRFWYERYLKGKVLQYIRQTKLSDIIQRNTNIRGMKKWAMLTPHRQPEEKLVFSPLPKHFLLNLNDPNKFGTRNEALIKAARLIFGKEYK